MKNEPRAPFRFHWPEKHRGFMSRCGKYGRRYAVNEHEVTCKRCKKSLSDEVAEQLEKS